MGLPILLACPGCNMNQPGFVAMSLFVGLVAVTFGFLHPLKLRLKHVWGLPRVTIPRIVSLLPLLAGPAFMFLIGRQSHGLYHVLACTTGLTLCVVYLWVRCCWLLQELHVTSAFRQMLFPGCVGPCMLLLGGVAGQWAMGMVWIVPMWPNAALPLSAANAIIGLPLSLFVYGLMNYVFNELSAAQASKLWHARSECQGDGAGSPSHRICGKS